MYRKSKMLWLSSNDVIKPSLIKILSVDFLQATQYFIGKKWSIWPVEHAKSFDIHRYKRQLWTRWDSPFNEYIANFVWISTAFPDLHHLMSDNIFDQTCLWIPKMDETYEREKLKYVWTAGLACANHWTFGPHSFPGDASEPVLTTWVTGTT